MERSNISIDAVHKILANVHTSMPGKITSYDDIKMTATVDLGLKRKYRNQASETWPLIDDVPVWLPVFGTSQLRPPKEDIEGHPCYVLFSERSMEEWLAGDGEPIDVKSQRRFSISDAVALPGVTPDALRRPRLTPDDYFEFSRGSSYMAIGPQGQLEFKRGNDDLFEKLEQLCVALEQTKVNTMIGLQPFDPKTLLAIGLVKEAVIRMRS